MFFQSLRNFYRHFYINIYNKLYLIKRLIKASTNKGDVVLDPFGGSGSTCVASILTKRKYIAFELDKSYYNLALKRINKAKETLMMKKLDSYLYDYITEYILNGVFSKFEFDVNFIKVDAKDRFLGKLAGVSDPERKRKIIGEEFIRVFEEESKKIGAVDYLAQGTIYPDCRR